MSTILAIIGLLVVAKVAFVFLFPVTAARIQIQQFARTADRMMQAGLRHVEEQARKNEQDPE